MQELHPLLALALWVTKLRMVLLGAVMSELHPLLALALERLSLSPHGGELALLLDQRGLQRSSCVRSTQWAPPLDRHRLLIGTVPRV